MNIRISSYLRVPLLIVLIASLASLIPFTEVVGRYHQLSLMTVYLFVAMSSAWNLLGGYAGQVSLGYVLFYGIGAYISIYTYNSGWTSLALGLMVGGLCAAVSSIVVGYPIFRLRGPFFLITTLGVAEAARILVKNWRAVGAASGISISSPPEVSFSLFYVLSLILAATTLILMSVIRHNRLGLALLAMKDQQDAAEAIGINTTGYKLLAHAIGAFIVGVSGALWGRYQLYADPSSFFGFQLSVSLVLITLVGGTGTTWGPVLGTLVFIPLRDYVSSVTEGSLHLLLFGLLIILIVLFEPRGMIGVLERIWRTFQRAKSPLPLGMNRRIKERLR